jgi:hypothetical protein
MVLLLAKMIVRNEYTLLLMILASWASSPPLKQDILLYPIRYRSLPLLAFPPSHSSTSVYLVEISAIAILSFLRPSLYPALPIRVFYHSPCNISL